MGIQQGQIDMLTSSSLVTVTQCPKNRHGCIHPAHQIYDCNPDFHRLTLWFSGDAHDSAHSLDHKIVSRVFGIRTRLSEAGHRTVDQFRQLGMEAFIIQPVLLKSPDFKILDQDIRSGSKFFQKFLSFGFSEIDGQ